jgi:glucose/arabinose dehydrogenase
MNRMRVLVRLTLLVGLIGAGLFVAQRLVLNAYAPSQPISISNEPARVTFERAFPSLILERPIFLTFPPDGTNRLAVISQYGSIFMFPNDPTVEDVSEVMNIRQKVVYTDREPEEGLLGLAFHPKFRENRLFFVYYTTADHTNVLSRFTMSADDPNRADLESEQELFRTPKKPYWNHNAGTIIFGPDGYLYIAVGDGGPGNDPHGNGQSLETVMGKILRIDVDHQDPGLNYSIPKDNPFVDVPNARGEIWALGLRNVWRMAFDRQTNRLWAGDVGQDTWEEINLIIRGGNYGWNIREGFERFTTTGQPPPAPPPAHVFGKLIDPVFAYNHSVGKAIIGGCVYRGNKVPELRGAYLFADYVNGQVSVLRFDEQSGKAISVAPIEPPTMPVFSFGEDAAGEVYFMTTQGIINRFVSKRGN